jgi:hypothetical protein
LPDRSSSRPTRNGDPKREHDAVATVLIIGASRGIGLETVKADGWSAKVCETLTSQAK